MAIATGTALAITALSAKTAADVYGAKKASSASKRAGDVQERAAREAAQYQRQVTGQTLGYLQQAQQAAQPQSSASYSALSRAMGLGGWSPQMPPQMPSQGAGSPFTFAPQGGPQGGMAGQPGGMVMLEAPTGERRAFPWQEAQRHIARGARVVGNG